MIFHLDPSLTFCSFQRTETSSLPVNLKMWFKSRRYHLWFCFMVNNMEVITSSVFTMLKSRLQISIELSWFFKIWNLVKPVPCTSPVWSFPPNCQFSRGGCGCFTNFHVTWLSWVGLGVCIPNKCPSDEGAAGLTSKQDFRCFWQVPVQIFKRPCV